MLFLVSLLKPHSMAVVTSAQPTSGKLTCGGQRAAIPPEEELSQALRQPELNMSVSSLLCYESNIIFQPCYGLELQKENEGSQKV